MIISKQAGASSQHNTSVSNEHSTMGMAGGSGSVVGPRGQLGDDIIIDDGIEERTVVIEQHGEYCPSLHPILT